MNCEIIEGSESDIHQIAKQNKEIFKDLYEPYELEVYEEKLKDKEPMIFLAMSNGKLYGSSIAFERDGAMYLWLMGIIKEARGHGFGNTLLETNENFTKMAGYNKITVKTYPASKEMIALLKKRNYKETKKEKDAIHFELNL